MAPTELWSFAEAFDQSRLDRLSAIAGFSQVIELVQNSIKAVHLESCNGRDSELQACIQPIFTIAISEEAFDVFFNSPAGYRACFLQDPNLGLAANLALVEALVERLLATARQLCIAELASIDMRTSILASSCKVWVHEDDFPFQSPTTDLAVEPWARAAAAGEQKANWGLCAPKGTRIQVKGALLDPSGNEVVPRKKVLRRHEIQRFGFS